MIIKKLTATFGKLNNDTLILKPGLNIVEAPNESGKSTWCAFIKAMLFGVDTSDRDKQGYLSDKTRHRPWSGASMGGTMELSCDMGDITLQRTSSGRAPMKSFSAVFTGGGLDAGFISGESAGEKLTGVSEQVFSRSAFIRQSGVRVGQTPELEKKISALVSSGDETTSYTEADGRLREWQRRRRFNKRGEIPALEAKLAELSDKLEELEDAAENTAALRRDMRELARERILLEQELAYYAALEAQTERERVERARKKLSEADAAAKELEEKLKAYGEPTAADVAGLKGEISALNSLRTMLESERRRAEEAQSEYAQLSQKVSTSPLAGKDPGRIALELDNIERGEKSAKTIFPILAAVPVLLTVLGIVLQIIAAAGIIKYAVFGLAVLSMILLAGCTLINLRRSMRKKQLLDDCGAKSISSLREKLGELGRISDELRRAENSFSASEKVLRNAESMYEETRKNLSGKLEPLSFRGSEPDDILKSLFEIESVLNAYSHAKSELSSAARIYSVLSPEETRSAPAVPAGPKPRRSHSETQTALEQVTRQLESCTSEYNMALGGERALGDPAVLRSLYAEADSRLAEQNTQYNAITLAIEALSDANTQLQTRFSPLLSKTAERFLTKLTGGKYEKLVFDKGFNAAAKTPDDPVSRDALYLSGGAADQVYLALRLAVCELVLPESDPCPIILDDAFANFDDVRAANALGVLLEIAEKRQVILFTCHGREANLLPDGAQVNIVKI